MDIFKGLQWVILIFVFYFFIFYQLFRIIYRKFKETDMISKIKIQKLDEKISKSGEKFQKSDKKMGRSKLKFRSYQ